MYPMQSILHKFWKSKTLFFNAVKQTGSPATAQGDPFGVAENGAGNECVITLSQTQNAIYPGVPSNETSVV